MILQPTRREMLAFGLAGASITLLPAIARAQRWIPQKPSARVIVDNDFAGDPDGLVALAHQLLAPKTRVTLLTASLLDPKFSAAEFPKGDTATAGAKVARELMQRLGVPAVPVAAGHDKLAVKTPSDAARAIVAEAMRDDKLPLFFTCGGPLTNLAEALTLEPRIASRMTLVWIGGGDYPSGAWEYNLNVDVDAARMVIERSKIPVWQVPLPTYRQMQISVAELAADMRTISPFSAWLYDRFTSPPDFIDLGGAWPMGDTPLVLATALPTESSVIRDVPARRIKDDNTYGEEIPGRTVRLFEQVDVRLQWQDFLARLKLHAASN